MISFTFLRGPKTHPGTSAAVLQERNSAILILDLKSPGRKSREMVSWLLPGDYLGHCTRRDWRQQNPIAKMSRSNEISQRCSRTQDRQVVRSSWPQAGPYLVPACLRQSWNQPHCRIMQALDSLCIHTLVISGIFDSGADQNPSIASWH